MAAVMMSCLAFIILLGSTTLTLGKQEVSLGGDENVNVVQRRISRASGSHMVEWVEHGHRKKRATFNETARTWPHVIPYVIDPSYTGDQWTLRQVMEHISSRLCITFNDVTNAYDPEDPIWFSSQGFETNSYMNIKTTGGCTSDNGQGNNSASIIVSPCDGVGINIHEMFHAIGATHTQQSPLRDRYMNVHESLVKPEFRSSYKKDTTSTLVSEFFVPYSAVMYQDRIMHLTGQETFTPIRDDLYHTVPSFGEEHELFVELSRIYRCNELFCNNDQTDCGPGYHTLINGRCRCVCPDELDYNTNCRTHINGSAKDIFWPNTQLILYGTKRCPSGFEPIPSSLPLSGTQKPLLQPMPEPYKINNTTITILLCKKSTPNETSDVNWSSWPKGGDFCFVKNRGEICGGEFLDGALEFKTTDVSHPIGDIGNITINGTIVKINYCCRNGEHFGLIADLPNSEPFRLVAEYAKCPVVRGMKSTYSGLTFYTKYSLKTGDKHPFSIFNNSLFNHYVCHYQPPIYGCSQFVTLNSTKKSVTITTPGFGSKREPDRRCFYSFIVPAGSRLRLTLNKFDPHVKDDFLVKRNHRWQEPVRISEDFKPNQLVSEGDYLSVQYWASWETTTNKGINFTVDVVLAKEMCYDVATRGADYYGEKSVTETFEPCIPWEKATSCDDFPFDGMNGISLLESGSNCRNPNGSLLQPWCYTFVDGEVCHKRYCDVCNILTPVNMLSNCSKLKESVPDFCTSAVERFGCFSTCGNSSQKYKPATCIQPSLPSDVYAAGGLKSVYKEGDVINVTCTTSGSLVNIIRCTKTGWSGQALNCSVAAACDDKIQNCKNILAKFPEFSISKRSSNSALTYCKKTCGGCPGKTQCKDPVGKKYSRTSKAEVISPGQVMTFKCQNDSHHVSGDLQRACSVSGALLGSEPVCQSTPIAVDIQLKKIRKRREDLPKGVAFLLDDANYRIPFNGKITKWYYYCQQAGKIDFIVFRPSGSDYKFVGNNSLKCEPKWIRTFNVPVGSQIQVKKNDVFGAFSLEENTLSITDCYNATVKLLVIPIKEVKSLAELQATTKFQEKKCLIPSLGVRLEPS